MPDPQIKVVVVNESASNNQRNIQFEQKDPLLQQLQEMKITSNLIKEITFNSTVNKFEYLQQLLSQQYKDFNTKINQLSSKQKQIVTKNIKNLNKNLLRLQQQMTKQKQSSSQNTLLGNKSELLELHKKVQKILQTKKNSQKFLKLSEGMLTAVNKLQKQLDQHVKGKINEIKMQDKK